MEQRRTDLAVEAKELWEESAQKTGELRGVLAHEELGNGYTVTHVEILNEEGEQSLGKPRGRYITLSMDGLRHWEQEEFRRGAEAVGQQLASLVPVSKDATVLVVGLGNRDVTPDAIGPKAMESVLVTRHLIENMPEQFGDFRPVVALSAGVLGATGLESGELIRAVTEKLKPACVIVVDALASRSLQRICTTVQLTDTGIVPGSGVGNHRMALNQESLGVPVVAIGVPTVVEAATLCIDLMTAEGEEAPDLSGRVGSGLFVTPKDIDQQVKTLSKLLGFGISVGLHVDLSVENVERLLI